MGCFVVIQLYFKVWCLVPLQLSRVLDAIGLYRSVCTVLQYMQCRFSASAVHFVAGEGPSNCSRKRDFSSALKLSDCGRRLLQSAEFVRQSAIQQHPIDTG